MGTEKRVRPMEVLCLSLPRTGTMTMQHALQTLGYQRVWHGDPSTLQHAPANAGIIFNELAIKKFRHGHAISRDEFEQVLYNFDAVTDIPPCYFWDDLLAAYPSAKVIIVERDVDTWHQSCVATLFATLFGSWHGWLMRVFVQPVLGFQGNTMLVNLTFGFFDARSYAEVQRKAKGVYTQHYANVRRACKEQGRPLLDLQLSDGYPRLCEFLEKEMPSGSKDFPRTNESHTLMADITSYQWSQVRAAGVVVLKWATAPAAAVGASLYYWCYMRL